MKGAISFFISMKLRYNSERTYNIINNVYN